MAKFLSQMLGFAMLAGFVHTGQANGLPAYTETSFDYSAYRQGDPVNEKERFEMASLETFLNFFGDCLSHVINYNGYDLPTATSPVILSRYDIVQVTLLKETTKTWLMFTRPEQKVFRRKVPFEKLSRIKHQVATPCKRDWLLKECMVENVDVPFLDLTTKIRPWRCEVHFYLLPPSIQEDEMFYEEIHLGERTLLIPQSYRKFWRESAAFRNTINGTSQASYIIDTRQRFEILILQAGKQRTKDLIEMIETWSRAVLQMFDMYGLQDIWITTQRELLVTFAWSAIKSDNLTQRVLNMLDDIIVLCRHCVRCSPLQPTNIGKLKNLYRSLDQINSDTDKMVGRIQAPLSMLASIWNHSFEFPSGEMTTQEFRTLLQWAPTLNFIRDEMTSRFLRSVHGNLTIHLRMHNCIVSYQTSLHKEPGCRCLDHINFYPHVVLAAAGDLRYSEMDFQHTDLLFVSCETPLKTHVDLENLVNIFDLWTWLSVLACVCIIPLVLMWVLKHHQRSSKTPNNFVPSCLMVFKILVEQGNPVTQESLLDIASYRTLFIPVIMVGLVISCAYKNENITRMTLPTTSLPFDRFHLLVENNFTILTRVVISGEASAKGNAWLDIAFRILNELVLIPLNITFEGGRGHELGLGLKTELLDFTRYQHSYGEQFLELTNIYQPSLSVFTQYLLNNTKRDPGWVKARANETFQQSVLQQCNKTAYLLPDVEAREMYYLMQQSEGPNTRKNVFLGDPSHPLLSFGLGLRFLHWTSPKILQRLRGLKQSGIVEWFENFVVKFMTKVKTPRNIFRDEEELTSFRPSNTKGNIVVVFVPFGVGIFLSLIASAAVDCNWQPTWLNLKTTTARLIKTSIASVNKY